MRQYTKYASRLSYMLSGGTHSATTAVLYPITSVWAALTPLDEKLPSVAGLNPLEREYWYYNANPHISKLQNIFDDTCRGLLSRQNDFDYLEDRDIASSEIRDGLLCTGDMKFNTILLPGCEYLSEGCCKKLLSFAENGGKIVLAGRKPHSLYDSNQRDLLDALLKRPEVIFDSSADKACEIIASFSEKPILTPNAADIYITHIQKGDCDLFFTANNSFNTYDGVYAFPLVGTPQIWDPWTGKVYSVPFTQDLEKTYVDVHIAGYRAHLFVFGSDTKCEEEYHFYHSYGYPMAEKANHLARIFEKSTAQKYCGMDNPGIEFYAQAHFSLHAPASGLALADATGGNALLSVAPDYRPGEIIEGLSATYTLEENKVYRFTFTAATKNINFWGVMPRHFDKNGTELIDQGSHGNWRNEFSVQFEHEPTEFSIWFRVPKGAVCTKIILMPLSKVLFENSAELAITNAALYCQRSDGA